MYMYGFQNLPALFIEINNLEKVGIQKKETREALNSLTPDCNTGGNLFPHTDEGVDVDEGADVRSAPIGPDYDWSGPDYDLTGPDCDQTGPEVDGENEMGDGAADDGGFSPADGSFLRETIGIFT